MNILIVGAGAIGCLVGGKLAQQGVQVTLLGRPALAQALSVQGGLRIQEADRDQRISGLNVISQIPEGQFQATAQTDLFDLVIFTVKSYDTATVGAQVAKALFETKPGPAALSLQNGVGNEEILAEFFTPQQVIAGTITAPVEVVEPGHIVVRSPKYTVGLSPWEPRNPVTSFEEIRSLFDRAGFHPQVHKSAASMKWTKLLMNMVGNAVSAILDEPAEIVFADPDMVNLELEAWRETLGVMRRADIAPIHLGKYPFHLLSPLIRFLPNRILRPPLARLIGGARGGKMASLHMDLARGKQKSEVGWLNGAVEAAGHRLGIPTPVNQRVNRLLNHLVAHPEEWAQWQHNHARLTELMRITA